MLTAFGTGRPGRRCLVLFFVWSVHSVSRLFPQGYGSQSAETQFGKLKAASGQIGTTRAECLFTGNNRLRLFPQAQALQSSGPDPPRGTEQNNTFQPRLTIRRRSSGSQTRQPVRRTRSRISHQLGGKPGRRVQKVRLCGPSLPPKTRIILGNARSEPHTFSVF